jgi:hypothetical protein
MRKYPAALLLFLSLFRLFSDSSDDIISEITKSSIKIGKKAVITTKLSGMKDMKILWQDLSKSEADIEVLSTKDSYIKDYLNLEIVFTSFKPKEYVDLYFTIPMVDPAGESFYLETKKYSISVNGVLSPTDLEAAKSIQDPSKIELKPEKGQEKFSFNFRPYAAVIVTILIALACAAVIFYLLYNYFIKKKFKEVKKADISPYERFLASMNMIVFEPDEDRKESEYKLSVLSESLKELIFGEFMISAPSETTRELIRALKLNNFDEDVTFIINKLFTEMDMIKFAKAPYDFDRLHFFYEKIKELGGRIHELYKYQNIEKKEDGANK